MQRKSTELSTQKEVPQKYQEELNGYRTGKTHFECPPFSLHKITNYFELLQQHTMVKIWAEPINFY